MTKEFTFEDSRIFPGTKRKGTVFIPAQYDGSTPACVYVQQDGFKKGDDAVLAELIAAKEMPVTVGVFIHPGMVTPAQGPPGAVRANRGLEYDSVDDKYPRFVLEELLPYVEKTFNVKLSDKAADRCIAGGSSGGIAAFNAAWWRPDAFSRVYAGSGSFSAFRYGNIFPTMVRKFEAKPIRVYLTTATNDMENAAGDWFLLDQEMDKALKFSGYDFEYFVVPGRHVSGYADHFADAMRFLWKGWPAPITPGPSSPRAQDIITGTDSWQVAADGYQDARSPVTNSKGEIFFVDPPANKIYRIAVDGSTAVFLDDAAHANGLAIGPKDELYTVSATTGNVMTYDTSGHGTVVVGELPGQYVVARPDGSLYVTNGGDVWLVKDGAKKRVDTGLKGAAGLAYRCDQWLLAVAEGASKWVCSYEIQPDGSLINKERYYPLFVQEWDDDASPGSLCYAKEGQMLVGTRAGVQSCTGDGPVQVILPLPDRSRVTGVALGGPDLHTLFACAGGKVWKRVVKLHGIGAFSPATPQPHTPL